MTKKAERAWADEVAKSARFWARLHKEAAPKLREAAAQEIAIRSAHKGSQP